MRQFRILDSIFTRLVAWSIAVCIAVVLILGALVGAKFEQLSSASRQLAIEADIATFGNAFRQGDREALAHRIAERLTFASPAGSAPHYLLVDENGGILAGDLPGWPATGEAAEYFASEELATIVLPNGREAEARAIRLTGDLRLLVARETTQSTLFLYEIGLAFVAGGLFVVLAVGVAGLMTTRRMAQRIGRINEALLHPDETRLEKLNRGRNATDEIGELTRLSSAALQRLNRLIDAHRDTLDQIAHEMRTPLMHLDNRLFRTLRTMRDEEAARPLVDARSEIRAVIAMLESLLDISQSEAHRGDRRGLAPVDLSAQLDHVCELYAASAEETGHRFEYEIAPGITLDGEQMQLTRLVTNLLDNAFKYVPSGGTVHLSLEPGPVISVADSGPGIAPEDRETIFERFSRGKSGSGESRGSGLGLALARAIAARHGLTLSLVPTIRGACFRIAPEAPEGSD